MFRASFPNRDFYSFWRQKITFPRLDDANDYGWARQHIIFNLQRATVQPDGWRLEISSSRFSPKSAIISPIFGLTLNYVFQNVDRHQLVEIFNHFKDCNILTSNNNGHFTWQVHALRSLIFCRATWRLPVRRGVDHLQGHKKAAVLLWHSSYHFRSPMQD